MHNYYKYLNPYLCSQSNVARFKMSNRDFEAVRKSSFHLITGGLRKIFHRELCLLKLIQSNAVFNVDFHNIFYIECIILTKTEKVKKKLQKLQNITKYYKKLYFFLILTVNGINISRRQIS